MPGDLPPTPREPIPSPRDCAYDRLALTIERMQDRRLTEHHALRKIHETDERGFCRCCKVDAPCCSMKVIDEVATA